MFFFIIFCNSIRFTRAFYSNFLAVARVGPNPSPGTIQCTYDPDFNKFLVFFSREFLIVHHCTCFRLFLWIALLSFTRKSGNFDSNWLVKSIWVSHVLVRKVKIIKFAIRFLQRLDVTILRNSNEFRSKNEN